MDFAAINGEVESFAAYVGELAGVIGHVGRVAPLHDYCAGLLASEGRRSVEPMAALTAPSEVAAQHQRLLHFVGEGDWSDAQVLAKVRALVVPMIERREPIAAWIVDDTSYPKQGSHSVGVHHQYCGQLGKQANCQVAVTLSIANHHASLPIAYQLYLPQTWTADAARRRKAHVPKAVRFITKPQIALMQIGAAREAGVAQGVVLMDASYGTNAALRFGIAALGLTYAAAILPTVKVCAIAEPQKRVSVKTVALGLPKHTWRSIIWREGSAEKLTSRFARVRVRTAPIRAAACRPEETLLIEWPPGEAAPTKYWLSNLPAKTKFRDLVDITKMRWRIERDYQELKQEIGLDHYEGRGWRGFHHHATLCIAAYGFLISQQEKIPPSAPRGAAVFTKPALPAGYRPRGAADQAAAPRPQLDRHHASHADRRARPRPATMPLLRSQNSTKQAEKICDAVRLAANTATSYNTALGYNALVQCTVHANTAVGAGAGASVTTGGDNNFFGPDAGNNDDASGFITGSDNTGLGTHTLGHLNSGFGNVAVGSESLVGCGTWSGVPSTSCLLTGSGNTGVGNYTLQYIQGAANNNTAIGYSAGAQITTGTYNTLLGADSALTNLTTGSNNIIIGAGTAADTATATTSTAVGIGQNVKPGTGDVAVGAFALTANTGDSQNNVAIGNGAMHTATSASANISVGSLSLYGLTTGQNNTAVGRQSLQTMTTQGGNTGVGWQALLNAISYNNTALGYAAGNHITSGGGNTVIGNGVASTTLNTGSNNILIGVSSSVDTPAHGTSNFLNIQNTITASTGNASAVQSSNTALVGIDMGTALPVNALDVNGAVVIGTSFAGVDSAPTNGLLVQGSVGIGTTSPHAPLDVNSTSIIIEQSNTPADNATCTAGTIWWDTGYIYVCTASGTVKRAVLSTF